MPPEGRLILVAPWATSYVEGASGPVRRMECLILRVRSCVGRDTTMKRKVLFLIVASVWTLVFLVGTEWASARAGPILTAYSRDQVSKISLTPGIAGNITFNSASGLAGDYADLESVPKSVFNSQMLDPQPASVGPNAGAVTNNNFILYGPHLATSDAVIANTLTSASNQALVNLSQADGGNAFANCVLTTTFTLKKPDSVTFSFTAQPFLQVLLANGVALPATANASLTAVVEIETVVPGKPGNEVFFWRPDGGAGMGPMGGFQILDPFSLNNSLMLNAAGQDMYNQAAGNFSAVTGILRPGTYELTFSLGEYADGAVAPFGLPQGVPEPSSVVLAGVGCFVVIGYGWLRRQVRSRARSKGSYCGFTIPSRGGISTNNKQRSSSRLTSNAWSLSGESAPLNQNRFDSPNLGLILYKPVVCS
jgi:hypothetical protein